MTAEIVKPNRYVTCSACHAMNPSFEATCDQCGAPINEPTTDESITEAAIEVRQTHFQPPSTLRLIGIWMLAVPNFVGGLYLAVWLVRHRGGLAVFLIFWGVIGVSFLWFMIFYRVTRNYFFPVSK